MASWFVSNWFNVLSAIGVIASLLFTGVSLRSETKNRRVSNLIALTQNHRDLWTEVFSRPGLERVLDPGASVTRYGFSLEEQFCVTMAIHHLHSAYQAMKNGLVIKPAGIREDVRTFFALPIPKAVWEKLRHLQNEDFVCFVDDCLEPVEKEA